MPRTNFWIYPGNDFDSAVDGFMNDPQAPFPVVYISFPSAKDPDYERRRPGTATIEIVAPAPFEWFEKWQGTTWGKRGDHYDTFKAQLGPRTRFKGLWLTGQDVLTCGVTGAMMAGLMTTSARIGSRKSMTLLRRIFGPSTKKS